MTQFNISGPGLGLPAPSSLYPGPLAIGAGFTPYTAGNNEITLAAGQALPIPAGTWLVEVGNYSVLQFLDPVTNIWRGFSSARSKAMVISSDGYTRRVANLTGCPVAAVVTTAGTTYTQAGTTVTSNAGGSTWNAIIGGLLTLTTISVAGSGYKLPPICLLPAPAPGTGVAATAVCAISSGTLNTITLTDQGAGYPAGLTVTLLPNPTDPNIASITNAVAVFGTTGAGTVAAVLCTNNGAPGTTTTTLTISGGDGAAAATAVMMWTILSATVTAAGAGYQASGLATTVGGRTAATAVNTNPSVELTGYVPRQAQMGYAGGGTLSTTTSISTFYDSGLFTGTPISAVVGGAVTTLASLTFGLGGKPDSVVMQPL